jgi:hypothetical protein
LSSDIINIKLISVESLWIIEIVCYHFLSEKSFLQFIYQRNWRILKVFEVAVCETRNAPENSFQKFQKNSLVSINDLKRSFYHYELWMIVGSFILPIFIYFENHCESEKSFLQFIYQSNWSILKLFESSVFKVPDINFWSTLGYEKIN